YKWPVALVVAGLLFSCQNKIEEINALHDENNLPVQTTYDAVYDYTEQGELRNRLIAKQLDRYIDDNPRMEAVGGFEMIIYDSLQQEEAHLSADKGIFLEQKNILTAKYNVLLTNINGDSLETEELIWLQDSGKVYTNEEVIISSKDGKLYGKGLESDEKFSTYTIRDIHGNFNVDSPKPSKTDSLGTDEVKQEL
ncbi:MAG: LPS export ABC transporter periplasmic protein LptC, partial [Flavobacteriales bacterium]|nr:LPS export ABC transporter periplasmic protein LptC [Flavobacteriales bacterium]